MFTIIQQGPRSKRATACQLIHKTPYFNVWASRRFYEKVTDFVDPNYNRLYGIWRLESFRDLCWGPIYYSKDTNNITCGACARKRNGHSDRGTTQCEDEDIYLDKI